MEQTSLYPRVSRFIPGPVAALGKPQVAVDLATIARAVFAKNRLSIIRDMGNILCRRLIFSSNRLVTHQHKRRAPPRLSFGRLTSTLRAPIARPKGSVSTAEQPSLAYLSRLDLFRDVNGIDPLLHARCWAAEYGSRRRVYHYWSARGFSGLR